MTHRHVAGLVLFLAGGCLAGALWACDSDVTNEPGPSTGPGPGSGGSAGAGGSAGGGGSGSGGQPLIETGHTYAFDQLYMGSSDRNGAPNPSAWRQYGFNIDNLVSDANSTDLCTPNAGGSISAVYPDGDNGIDNAFGKLLWPIFTGLAADAEEQINDQIDQGLFSYIIWIDDLGADADYPALTARAYEGALLSPPPAFDGNDIWPVTYESLTSPNDITSSRFLFAGSTVANHHFATPVGELDLLINFLGTPLRVQIQQARIEMDLATDRSGATLGMLGGVLGTEAFIEAFRRVAGAFDVSLCSGTTFNSIADQFRQASDILQSGTQDPNQTCDAISIGLGFDASKITIGPIAAPAVPPVDPCAP